MNVQLKIILIFFKNLGFISCRREIYVTSFVTRYNDSCLSDGKPCRGGLLTITKDNNTRIATVITFSGNCSTRNLNLEIVNRTSILEYSNYTICLLNVTANDAGIYEFQRVEDVTVITLYVLDKTNAPQITVLNNGTVKEAPAEVKCHATSNSEPPGLSMTYTWFVNNSGIGEDNTKYFHLNNNNSILLIHVEMIDMYNNYTCVATEQYGQPVASHYGVNIYPRRLPHVQIKPNITSLKIVEYGDLSIECTTSGAFPDVLSYTWYKNEEVLQIGGSNILALEKISRSDTGVYNCTAYNGLERNVSDVIEIEVLFGPYISDMPQVSQVDGFGLNITCNVSSNPTVVDDSVTWSRDNTSAFSVKGKTLVIPNINIKDDGEFKCSVSLSLKPTYGNPVVKYDTRIIDVDVLYGPRVSSTNVTNPKEGDNVSMSCDIDSNPVAKNANVTWYFITNINDIHVGNGIQNTISAIQRNESGTYKCMVQITMMPTNGQQIIRTNSSSLEINVLYQPYIKRYDSTTVFEKEVANMSCRVLGNPKPNIFWIYSRTNRTYSESYSIHHSPIEVTSIFLIPNVTCNKTGSYACIADNAITNPVFESRNLVVKCSPSLEFERSSYRNLSVRKDEILNFTEWFYAYPQPSFHFFKGNSTFPNQALGFDISNVSDDQLSYRTGSIITKQTFEHSDIGSYVLVAANDIGSLNVSYNIIYKRKPEKPFNVRVNCEDSYSTSVVEWNAGWNGGSKQNFNIVYRRTKTEYLSHGTNSPIEEKTDDVDDVYSYSLFGLLPNENYIFIINATNDIGSETSEEINCTTTGIPETSNNDLLLIGLGSGGTMGIVLVIIVAVVYFSRRKGAHKKEKNMELLESRNGVDSFHEDSEEGLKDNICYISAGEIAIQNAEYAVVQKKVGIKKDKEKKPSVLREGTDTLQNGGEDGLKDNICYISADDIDKKVTPTAEYAIVRKPFGKKKDGSAGLKNPFSKNKKETRQNDAYEVVERRLSYGDSKKQTKKKENELPYADLDFTNTPNKSKFVIKGDQNKTNYSDIDFSKKAEPLPDDVQNDDTYMNL